MSALRQLRNFWISWVATIVLASFSNAVAQTSYKVTDLGTEGNNNLACAMSVNNEGWTEIMGGPRGAAQRAARARQAEGSLYLPQARGWFG